MKLSHKDAADFATIYDYLHVEIPPPPGNHVDAIIVGGAGTRTDMADRAAELFRAGVAPLVVVSGFAHPDFDVNEAELLASRATKLGVPAEKIIIEPRATNTGLNIILAADALKKRGVTPQAVVLVHKPYMTRRFLATAEAQWPTPRPKFYVTSVNLTFDEYIRLEKSRELDERALSSILKDYQSIKDYPARGFQSAQPTSPEAEQAFQRLIKRGFLPMPREDNLSTDNFR